MGAEGDGSVVALGVAVVVDGTGDDDGVGTAAIATGVIQLITSTAEVITNDRFIGSIIHLIL